MSRVIESIERRQLRRDLPQFKAGDTVRVHFQVIEGQRRRLQVFEGIVIKRQGAGMNESFTVRKQSFGVGVERTFPLHSPKIEKVELIAIGDVSRAKLYELIATGALPAVKVDGCRRIRTQDLYDFVARLATSATATRSPGRPPTASTWTSQSRAPRSGS